MIYSCEEHIDLAIDVFVDTYETFPILTKTTDENLSTGCEYCEKEAVYIVANP